MIESRFWEDKEIIFYIEQFWRSEYYKTVLIMKSYSVFKKIFSINPSFINIKKNPILIESHWILRAYEICSNQTGIKFIVDIRWLGEEQNKDIKIVKERVLNSAVMVVSSGYLDYSYIWNS